MKIKNLKTILAIFIITIIVCNINVNSQWNWQYLNTGTNAEFNSLCFLNPNTGYVCGEHGIVAKTKSGGFNCTVFNTGLNISLCSISFGNERVGFATGYFG